MRSSVSYMLSQTADESAMSHPDYSQQGQHHACMLILVKGIGGVLKNFNKLWERIQRVDSIKVNDSSGQVREIYVRYVRDYPVENNDWGDFQTHRRLLGLITFSKFTNQAELNEVCRVHESLKARYSTTLYDSRAFMFGPVKDKKPEPEVDLLDVARRQQDPDLSESERMSLRSDISDSFASSDSFSMSSASNENLTTPSNFKTQASFYAENDPVEDLEKIVVELINAMFWVLESKRLERSREKLEKVALILAPFERKDFVGVDMESRNNKKRCMGRVTKNLADLTLQSGLLTESLSLYNSAAETLKAVNDWLWLGASLEGLCATSAIQLYPNLRNPQTLQRNTSLQERSPKKLSINDHSNDVCKRYHLATSPLKSKNLTPIYPPSDQSSSSESSEYSITKQSKTDSSDSLSIDEPSGPKSFAIADLPSLPRHTPSLSQFMLSGEEINERYRTAIIHYSKYQNAGIIESEACLKAARIAIEQGNALNAATFLQNVIFINLNLTEMDKIQRFHTLAELYQEIGFHRKASFCMRLAATRQVSPGNPAPDWASCYKLLLMALDAHCPPNGWPILQIQLLEELVVAAKRMGHPALATRHMTYLLDNMWDHLSPNERRDLAIKLQALSAACEGAPVPLVLSCGRVVAGASLRRAPRGLTFNPRRASADRAAKLKAQPIVTGPFIFTPIHFGSLERKPKTNDGKLDFFWVEDDLCEVELTLVNPLPFELKVSNIRLMTSGVVFESVPETVILTSDVPTTVILTGTPKEAGDLHISGYSTHALGVRSNCRLKSMENPHKLPEQFTIQVLPKMPYMTVIGEMGAEHCKVVGDMDRGLNVSLYNGESVDCNIKLTNNSPVAINFINVAVISTLDPQTQNKVFQWSDEAIQSYLPIKPNQTVEFPLKIYAEADFLDVSSADNPYPSLSINNYGSRTNSRAGSPGPNQQSSLPTTQGSQNTCNSLTTNSFQRNKLTSSFRSNNSQGTSWSAPISVLAPSKGRQLETQLVIRYSGGKAEDNYSRQAELKMNLELLPSVAVTHWDVLPCEVPSQFYLVLDVANLTNQEMEVEYSPGKNILIEAEDSCRVPIPLDKCPLSDNQLTVDESPDNRSNSINSANSLERHLARHIMKNVELKWTMLADERSGRATVDGITLPHSILDIVQMSPLNWDVKVNNAPINPLEALQCVAGECVALQVGLSNSMPVPLKDLRLSVKFHQDYNNAGTNAALHSRLVVVPTNEFAVSSLEQNKFVLHSCNIVVLYPGEYRMQLECRSQDESNTWRFMPHVAFNVAPVS